MKIKTKTKAELLSVSQIKNNIKKNPETTYILVTKKEKNWGVSITNVNFHINHPKIFKTKKSAHDFALETLYKKGVELRFTTLELLVSSAK